MKKLLLAMLLMGMSLNASATDDCTPALDAYVQGIEFGVSSLPKGAKRDQLNNQLIAIKRLRLQYSDCEVKRQVPLLSLSDNAVTGATQYEEKVRGTASLNTGN